MKILDRFEKAAQGEEEQSELPLTVEQHIKLGDDNSEKYFIREVAPFFRTNLGVVLEQHIPGAKIFGRGRGNLLWHDRKIVEFLIDVKMDAREHRLRLVASGSYMTKNDGIYYLRVEEPGSGAHDTWEKFDGNPQSDARRMVDDAVDIVDDFVSSSLRTAQTEEEQLEFQMTSKRDELQQIVDGIEASVSEPNDERGAEIPEHGPVVVAYSFAMAVAAQVPNTVVLGYHSSNNPTAEIGKEEDGHDFAIVENRYVVDGWAQHVAGIADRSVFDMLDPTDKKIIKKLYGDPSKWEPAKQDWDKYEHA